MLLLTARCLMPRSALPAQAERYCSARYTFVAFRLCLRLLRCHVIDDAAADADIFADISLRERSYFDFACCFFLFCHYLLFRYFCCC